MKWSQRYHNTSDKLCHCLEWFQTRDTRKVQFLLICWLTFPRNSKLLLSPVSFGKYLLIYPKTNSGVAQCRCTIAHFEVTQLRRNWFFSSILFLLTAHTVHCMYKVYSILFRSTAHSAHCTQCTKCTKCTHCAHTAGCVLCKAQSIFSHLQCFFKPPCSNSSTLSRPVLNSAGFSQYCHNSGHPLYIRWAPIRVIHHFIS